MSTAIVIGPDVIPVRPDESHEYVIDTAAAAKGYGVSSDVIRQHKTRQSEELIEGKHWIACVTNSHAGQPPTKSILWTKRGVVRLGFTGPAHVAAGCERRGAAALPEQDRCAAGSTPRTHG